MCDKNENEYHTLHPLHQLSSFFFKVCLHLLPVFSGVRVTPSLV